MTDDVPTFARVAVWVCIAAAIVFSCVSAYYSKEDH